MQLCAVPNLQAFIHLKKLNLNNNSISSLEGIEKLPTLEYLDVSHNKISDYKPLYKLNNLKELTTPLISKAQLKELQYQLPNTKINK